ncbi:ornithine carbamoyltransferase [Luminiphilus syltensis NOR5-1B]|uniref:Ornithine carbamoyltransferase n=1 Tax=Luminiphilus syltensis NOR5-1B TaxID=565045 RepID=B8KSM9_9GAMM|nr:ornithine carbamoyltransferase [Luminiphilus syltensis]EED34477.1 ornithine carbamoyltransferase [Luminiphilus syltensis NOR5-1B]
MAQPRHFLTLDDINADEFRSIIARATELKRLQREGISHARYPGKVLAMIFAKASTRTRVSFEAGMTQLGGSAMFLSAADTQLGRGEPVEDTARVISSMVDAVMIRTFEHSTVERFARMSSVPVINGLTNDFHPCQLLADMQTWFEHRGDIAGRRVCWLGDGNNMCQSYINAARLLDFELVIACPEGYEPDADLVAKNAERVRIEHDADAAVEGVDLLVTDVWASMGQEEEQKIREAAMAPFQLSRGLLARAAKDALYLHCLPAHRGEEITAELMDAPDSVIWDEAENRLHAQKALLEFLLG